MTHTTLIQSQKHEYVSQNVTYKHSDSFMYSLLLGQPWKKSEQFKNRILSLMMRQNFVRIFPRNKTRQKSRELWKKRLQGDDGGVEAYAKSHTGFMCCKHQPIPNFFITLKRTRLYYCRVIQYCRNQKRIFVFDGKLNKS